MALVEHLARSQPARRVRWETLKSSDSAHLAGGYFFLPSMHPSDTA